MKFSLLFATLLVLSTGGGRLATAFATYDNTVVCNTTILPEPFCRGTLYTEGPSIVMLSEDPTDIGYAGRFLWVYSFVRGLPHGYVIDKPLDEVSLVRDLPDGYLLDKPQDQATFAFGPNVEIEMDIDGHSCNITVGNETCNSCQPCGGEVSRWNVDAFSADCTNLKVNETNPFIGAGKMMACEKALPFFYPLEILDGPIALPLNPPVLSAPTTKLRGSSPGLEENIP
jgi:hypothetical protein